MLNYLFYSIAGLGISYSLYCLFLKKEKCFHFNRFYLLLSLVLCLLAPLLELNPGPAIEKLPKVDLEQFSGASTEIYEESITGRKVEVLQKSSPLVPRLLWSLYLLGSGVLFFRFSRNLLKLTRSISLSPTTTRAGMKVILIGEKQNPFSFFHYLFINSEDFSNSSYSDSVLKHEATHSRQGHSFDTLLLELLSCIFWFNPFLWLYKKAVLANHEYLADAAVVEEGIGIEKYCQQIIQSGNKDQNFQLSSGFSFIQTKNRLTMLHKNPSSRTIRVVRILSVLAIFALVFTFSSFTHRSSEPFVVVVDPGHGGRDSGSLNEKTVALAVGLELKALSSEEVKIILTRDSDVFYTLKERSDFIKTQQPDLVVTLHCDSRQETFHSGMRAIYSEQHEASREYARLLLEEQLEENHTGISKLHSANFFIFRESPAPAVMLELGFLSNPEDRKKLEDPGYQRSVAQSMYNAFLKIRENRK